jgi:hypothetical protein
MDLPFRVIQILRDARVKRYKEEAERQERERKNSEKKMIRDKILSK